MTTTRIAGPLDERHAGAIHALARTVSYSHRIRAIARTAAETDTVPVNGNRRGSAVVSACGCPRVAVEGPAARVDAPALCPHTK